MTKRARGYVRDPADGSGVASATVTLKKHADATTVTTDGTDANGLFEMDADTVGYPGPVYEETTVGATTKVRSGNVWGQLGGLVWAGDIPDALQAFGIGVVSDVSDELAVSADGSDMQVDIAAGVAILKDGCPYVLEAATALTISAADGSNPRIDRIILRLTREGQTTQGKISLQVLAGTPAASPAVTALTQSSATWDLSLAQILVGTGVTTIASNKVTDERTFVGSAVLQPLDADLTAIAALVSAADKVPYATGSGAWALADLTAAGRALIDDASAAAQRTTIAAAPLASPTFTGTVTAAALVATGDTTFGDAGTDTTILQGHFRKKGSVPTINPDSALGSGGSVGTTIAGNDFTGKIVLTAGTTSLVAGVAANITFAVEKPDTNYSIQLTQNDTDASINAVQWRCNNASTLAWSLSFNVAPTSGSTYIFFYTVQEWSN